MAGDRPKRACGDCPTCPTCSGCLLEQAETPAGFSLPAGTVLPVLAVSWSRLPPGVFQPAYGPLAGHPLRPCRATPGHLRWAGPAGRRCCTRPTACFQAGHAGSIPVTRSTTEALVRMLLSTMASVARGDPTTFARQAADVLRHERSHIRLRTSAVMNTPASGRTTAIPRTGVTKRQLVAYRRGSSGHSGTAQPFGRAWNWASPPGPRLPGETFIAAGRRSAVAEGGSPGGE